MSESDTALDLTLEIPPSGWRRVADARKQAIDQMVSAIVVIVDSVWAGQLPGTMVQKARQQVRIGVRKAVAILTLRNKQAQMENYWDSAWYLEPILIGKRHASK